MDQLSFSDAEHHNKRKRTRREIFLDEMDRSIPWDRFKSIIEPFYPNPHVARPSKFDTRGHAIKFCFSDLDEPWLFFDLFTILGRNYPLPHSL